MEIFVNGTLMRGLPLHSNLEGCRFVREDRTEPEYLLHALGEGSYPGMIHVGRRSGAIEVPGEVYEVPDDRLEAILAQEPPHLYLGPVYLRGDRTVQGILCEREAALRAPSISSFGGWRQYIASRRPAD